MTDDLVKRLRCYADIDDHPWVYGEAADRIEKLECEITSNAIHLDVAMVCMLNDKTRIEKLEAALRFIAGPSTVEFVDGTYEISETKMLSTYRRRAKRALEGEE